MRNNYNHNNTTNYVSLNPSSDKDLRNFPEVDDSESKLHLLYPGRPMSKYYNIDRSNIPNEAGDAAAYEMLDTKNSEEERYQKKLQKTLMAGPRPIDDPTNPKMLIQPAVDPYEMIEDPQARFVNLENPPIVNEALPIPVGAPLKENFQNIDDVKDEKTEPTKPNYYLWIGIIILIIFIVIAIRMLRG
mgnify:CR=1 FL=1